MKKIIIFLMCFLQTPLGFAFGDIENNWYKESIMGLKESGVIDGYENGDFGPYDEISRAEILKIILNTSDTEIVEALKPCFSDVDIESWQAKYICSGVENSIANGYLDGTFKPNGSVTVLETLAFAVRAFEIDLNYLGEGDNWYEKYQAFAHSENIIPMHAYTLDDTASRGIAANIIYRISEFKNGELLNFKSIACESGASLKSGEYSIDVNGSQREYLLYVPSSYDSDDSYGLIVAFHGRTNSNEMVRDYMKLGGGAYGNTKNQQDFIVAYPSGVGNGPYSWSQYENIEFFDAIITDISESLCVDRDSIFTVGHSLGSWMSNKVSCERGDVIRAMVGVASDGYNGECSGAVTSLITHLPGDHLASYQGGLNAYNYKSQQNKCSSETTNMSIGDIRGCEQKVDCSLGNSVSFCNSYSTYGDDPHSWPDDGSDDILNFLKDL